MRDHPRVVYLVALLAALDVVGGCQSCRRSTPPTGEPPLAPPAVVSAQKACADAVERDRGRLALQLRARKIAPADYLLRVRDRTAKLDLCERDTDWALAYVGGDQDGDLTPDARDRCPGTPDLVPTDDRGCPRPLESVPHAPTPEAVDKAFQALGFVFSPACEGAPDPASPTPIRLSYATLRPPFPARLAVEVTRASQGPAGCHLLYEVTLHGERPSKAGAPPAEIFTFVFRDTDDQNHGTQPTVSFERELGPGNPISYQDLAWRVRAMNGTGLTSAWSEARAGLRLVN